MFFLKDIGLLKRCYVLFGNNGEMKCKGLWECGGGIFERNMFLGILLMIGLVWIIVGE